MATVLITGCDRGLGEEFALQYAANGDRVIATCLDTAAFAQKHLAIGKIEPLELDVTDEAAVMRMARHLHGIAIDILINNAGIPGPHPAFEDTDLSVWRNMLEVNLIAPFVISKALTKNVAASEQKIIAFLSSRMGSIGLNNTGRSYAYRSSKAGLNMVMKSLAIDLARQDICVLGLHPGNVANNGRGLTMTESVERMREVIAHAGPHQTGTFYNYNGQLLPW